MIRRLATATAATAAAGILAAAGAIAVPAASAAPAPAVAHKPSVARDATARDGDSLHPYWCSNGVASLSVDYAKDGGYGHVIRIDATNGTGRRITFTDIYASTGDHRAESYPAIVGAWLAPGDTVYAGGHGPTHRLPMYVVGDFRATSNPGCTGRVVVTLDAGY